MTRVFVYGALMQKYAHGKAASLPGYKVSFTAKGVSWFEPSFATLKASPDDTAWGIILDLPKTEWQENLKREIGYSPKEISVYESGNKEKINCLALFFENSALPKETNPSARYANLLYEGALHHKLPNIVIERYKKLRKKGNPWTVRLQFLFPFARLFVPLVGRERAFVSCLMSIGILFALLLMSSFIWI